MLSVNDEAAYTDYLVERDNEADLKFKATIVAAVENPIKKLTLYRTESGTYVCVTYEYGQVTAAEPYCYDEGSIVQFFGYDSLAKQLYKAADIDASRTID
jgi:hypothetical protein